MNAVATRDPSAIIENVIVKGDLSKLTSAERSHYYVEVCKSVGLNPLTKPFEYITLNGKLTLYALRGCTDQLRAIHKVSVVDLTETERDGVFIVTAKVQNGDGRTDMAKGAVTLGTLKGDALANALMKAETKAKRRATLSICGLGFLDETEIETIPETAKRTRAEIQSEASRKRQEMNERIPTDLAQIRSLAELERYKREVLTPEFMSGLGSGQYGVEELVARRQEELEAEEPALDIDEATGEIIVDDAPIETRADYIRDCHERIDRFDNEADLLNWWNHAESKSARRRFSLTKEEVQALMTRTMERREELVNPLGAG